MNTLPTDIGEKKLFSREQNERRFLLKGRSWQAFWHFGVFRFIIATGICFLVLTGIAMLFYPGGTMTDPHVHGYAFFSNFLSDLGRTATPSGQDNLVSHLLFMLALIIGAFGILLLFAAFTQFFTSPGTARWFSRLAAVCGFITGLCFIGVAVVPLDQYGLLHNLLLYTASLTFIVAYLLLFLAVLLTPGFRRRCVYVFAVFAFLIAGSLLAFILTFILGQLPGHPRGRLSMPQGRRSLSLPQSSPGFWRYFLCSHCFMNNDGLPFSNISIKRVH